MPLYLEERFQERERTPMKRFAVYEEDERKWCVTLSIEFNDDAEAAGQQCVENAVYNVRGRKSRKTKHASLFLLVDFQTLRPHFIEDAVTQIELYTALGPNDDSQNRFGILTVPSDSFPGISLDRLRCLIKKDDKATILYPSLQEFQFKYPHFLITHPAKLAIKRQINERVYLIE